jgi:4,5-dihydroxyphthalate decarboxylase
MGIERLRLALGADYDRTRALRDGRVSDPRLRIEVTLLSSPSRAFAAVAGGDYDGGEMSLSFMTTLRSRDDDRLVALPVYLSRMLRHGNILVAASSGIDAPTDLVGKVVGLPEYGMTMGVWVRGLLQHEYGVEPTTISWRTGRSPVVLADGQVRYPDDVEIEQVPPHETLLGLLADGRIDAYIGPVPPDLCSSSPYRRLFSDHHTAERDYLVRTGIFPIMHLLVLSRRRLEERPWLKEALTTAAEAARDLAVSDLLANDVQRVSLPFLAAAAEDQRSLMGGQLWPYGIDAGRASLETFLGYAEEQGLLWAPLTVDGLFS